MIAKVNDLSGKVILVAGAGGGLGRHIVEELTSRGGYVYATSRSPQQLPCDCTESLMWLVGNSTNAKELRRMRDVIKRRHSQLDGLVYNIGSGKNQAGDGETDEGWLQSFDINFFGLVRFINVMESMLRDDGSSITCIGSICGHEVIEGAPTEYNCAKAALSMYVKTESFRFGPRGIRINEVAPGNILHDTSVWAKKMEKNPAIVQEMLEKTVPCKRLASASEISSVVGFLMSDESRFINGSSIRVDGGQTRGLS